MAEVNGALGPQQGIVLSTNPDPGRSILLQNPGSVISIGFAIIGVTSCAKRLFHIHIFNEKRSSGSCVYLVLNVEDVFLYATILSDFNGFHIYKKHY